MWKLPHSGGLSLVLFLCLDSGPPPGTNPQLWNLCKASQLDLIVPVGSEMPQGLVKSITLVPILPESSLPSQIQSQRLLCTYIILHGCLSYYHRNPAARITLRAFGIFPVWNPCTWFGFSLPHDN